MKDRFVGYGFFNNSQINSEEVKYDVVKSFGKLMEIVGAGTVSQGVTI